MANIWHNTLTVSGKKELLDEFSKEEEKLLPFINKKTAGKVYVLEENGSIIYSFDTKWSPPIEEIYDSADRCRELTFSLYTLDVLNKQIYCSFTIKHMVYWDVDTDEQGETERFITEIEGEAYSKKHPYRKFGK